MYNEAQHYLDHYKQSICFASGFPEEKKQAIYDALKIYIRMCIDLSKMKYVYRPLEIIIAPVKDAYGMVQPLIDGAGGINSYRIYISDKYDFTDQQLKAVFLHEMVHTMSGNNILEHKTILYASAYRYILRYYDINIRRIEGVKEYERTD